MNCLLSYDFWDRVVDSVRDWYDPNSAYRNLPDDVCLFYLFRYIYIQYENVTFHLLLFSDEQILQKVLSSNVVL